MASSLAIIVCQLPALAQVTGLLLTGFWATRQYRQLGRGCILRHHGGQDDTVNLWTRIDAGPAREVEGKLIHSGFRSAGLLILVIRANNSGKTYRVPIWCDSVSALEYSYLTLQLSYNTADASDQTHAVH